MSPFEYVINYWCDIDEKEKKAHGVTFANSYSDAMTNIEDYYGDCIIDVLSLFGWEEQTVYEFEQTQNEFSHGKFKVLFQEW